MLSLWQQQSGGSAVLLDARAQLRRPPDGPVTQPEANTIRSQFPRLPNPDMVLYVFPHLNGNTAGARLQHCLSLLHPPAVCIAGRTPDTAMSERRGLTEQALNANYRKGPSFVDWLPWVEFCRIHRRCCWRMAVQWEQCSN